MNDPAKRELLLLWREIKFDMPARLTIPATITLQRAWRSSSDFNEATLAVMHAANKLGSGVWDSLCSAGSDAAGQADVEFRRSTERKRGTISKMQTQMLSEKMIESIKEEGAEHAMNSLWRAWTKE